MARRGNGIRPAVRTGNLPTPAEIAAANTPRATMAATYEEHSGPLPRPEDFAGYDAIMPGAAQRILTMAEQDQKHMREMDQAVVRAHGRDVWQARAAATAIPLCSAVCGMVVALAVDPWAGVAMAAVGGAPQLVAAILRQTPPK